MYFARSGSPGRRTASAYSPCSARRWIGLGVTLTAWKNRMMRLVAPTVDLVLTFCAYEPIERVFLEDIARRGLGRFSALEEDGRLVSLCHVGANVVPSGVRCAPFADATVRGHARMLIGEERAVAELWGAASFRMPAP